MVCGPGTVQTDWAMKRALFVRTAVIAIALLLASLLMLPVAALARSVACGQEENDGRDARARASANTARREAAAIVIASARTGAGEKAQEALAFTLAEGAGRDLRDAHDARGAETTDQTVGAGGAGEPGVSRMALAIPQVIPGLGGGVSRRADGQEEEPWAGVAFREIGRVLPPLGFERGAAGPPALALSVFMGRKNGDVFSSLHEEYAWRMKFKSMTLGLGFYREIAVGEKARILPYVGVIRSSLSLRPAGLASEQLLHEYQLTVLCFGLPLVIGF